MKQELKNEKVPELLDIRLKLDSKEKLVPIKINDQFSKTKIRMHNSLNRTHLPPINKDKIRNSTANKIERDLSMNSKISSIKKDKDKDKDINEEQNENKSTKNSFNTSDNNFNFKNMNNFNNLNKQENKEKKLKIIQELSPESKISLRNFLFSAVPFALE